MKLTIESKVLSRALTKIRGVVEVRNTIPILSNVRLDAKTDRLTLTATDLDMEIIESVPAEISEPGDTTVPAHLLNDLIKKLPDGADVVLELKDQLAVKSGRSRFTLQILPAADFPTLAVGEYPKKFAMEAKDLRTLIDQTQFAISTEETRYYLNGIYFHPMKLGNRKVLRCVSTDGHRLAQAQVTAPEAADDFAGVIIPRKTVGELAKLLEKPEGTVSIELSDFKIRVTIGDVVLTSKLIDGTFPDYARVLPQGNDKTLKVDKATFRQAVDRVATISSERGRAVKLALDTGKLAISVNNPDAGSAIEELVVEYASDPMEIGFNSKYLLDLAAHLGSGEVEFLLADPGSPTLVRTVGELDTLFVLMPMRV